MKNDLVLILVRKNSKRLKHKSFLKVNNKTLFERTINFSKKFYDNDQILVSTDDKKIYNLSNKLNIVCPWLRPKYLSNDASTSYAAALHAIKWYEKTIKKVENIILFQCTTPFRRSSDFLNVYSLFKKKNKTVISYSEINLSNNTKKIYFNNKIKNFKKNFGPDKIPNGSYFLIKKKILFKEKTFYSKNHFHYLIKSFKYGIDIDTKYDYHLASKI